MSRKTNLGAGNKVSTFLCLQVWTCLGVVPAFLLLLWTMWNEQSCTQPVVQEFRPVRSWEWDFCKVTGETELACLPRWLLQLTLLVLLCASLCCSPSSLTFGKVMLHFLQTSEYKMVSYFVITFISLMDQQAWISFLMCMNPCFFSLL